MTTDNNIQPQIETPKEGKRNNKPLIAILVLSITPILAAYTMFFTGIGVPTETRNNGFLMTPAINVSALLADESPQVIEQWQKEKKWRLLLPISAECGEACEQNVYTSRQVHIRLGEKSKRVERVAVSLAGELSDGYIKSLEKDHPLLKRVSVGEQQWQQWVAQTNLVAEVNAEHYYILLDQEGYAMMWYTPEIHGNDLLKDLKHALKFSIDYE